MGRKPNTAMLQPDDRGRKIPHSLTQTSSGVIPFPQWGETFHFLGVNPSACGGEILYRPVNSSGWISPPTRGGFLHHKGLNRPIGKDSGLYKVFKAVK